LVVSLYLVCLVRTSFLGCVCLTVCSVEASSSVVIVVVVQTSPSRAVGRGLAALCLMIS
jgi:hypothetical protein